MNLRLVVLSEDDEVFFKASLVTSESLATTFTLPTASTYTIGLFRISLVELVVFQLQSKKAPKGGNGSVWRALAFRDLNVFVYAKNCHYTVSTVATAAWLSPV